MLAALRGNIAVRLVTVNIAVVGFVLLVVLSMLLTLFNVLLSIDLVASIFGVAGS